MLESRIREIDMSNSTSPRSGTEEVHWALTTLSHLDTWCGATCHTLLRYVLRCLLVLALTGTFVAILMRTLDSNRRAELEGRACVDNTIGLLDMSKSGSVAETLRHAGMGVTAERTATELSHGPDVKDSCAVM